MSRKCSVCTLDYDEKLRQPKLLECLHVICSQCIDGLSTRTEASSTLRCPNCNCNSDLENIRSNYLDYSGGVHGMGTTLNIICGECETNTASWYCMHCDEECASLCEGCASKHKELKAFRKHEVVPFFSTQDNPDSNTKVAHSKVRIMCDKHNRHELDGYCKKCEVIICLNCAIFDHKEHDYIRIAELSPTHRSNMNKALRPIIEKNEKMKYGISNLKATLTELDTQNDQAKVEVEDLFEDIFTFLHNRLAEVRQIQGRVYKRVRGNLTKQIETAEAILSLHEETIDFATKIEREALDIQVLDSFALVINRLKTVLEVPCNVVPPNIYADEGLQFSRGPDEELKRLIAQLGCFRGSEESADPSKSLLETIAVKITPSGWQCDVLLILVNEKGDRLQFGKYPVAVWMTHMANQMNSRELHNKLLGQDVGGGAGEEHSGNISASLSMQSLDGGTGSATVNISLEEYARYREPSTGVRETIPCSVTDNENGTYTISFQTLIPGQYSLKVKVFGALLSCCPFYAEVRPGPPQVIWGVDRGTLIRASSMYDGNIGYGPENLRVMDTSSSWLAGSSGEEHLDLALCAADCVIARVELLTFYAKAFKLSYRPSKTYAVESETDIWMPFPSTPSWTDLPVGLGKLHVIQISLEERLQMGMVCAVRIDVVNEGKKMTSLCGLNVFGWY